MKKPLMENLTLPNLMRQAAKLSLQGKLALSQNGLVYLEVDNHFIHQLFPLLNNKTIQKPDYFGPSGIGAHITVMYPEEGKKVKAEKLGEQHNFTLQKIVAAQIGTKTYYVLLVASSSLLEIRREHQLTDLLSFKNYAIPFHVTIGVSNPN